jgi:hypothetical protein
MKRETAIAVSQHIKQSTDLLGKMLHVLETKEAASQEATSIAPKVADLLIECKVANADQRDRLVKKLASGHADCLEILSRVVTKMAAVNKEATTKLAAYNAAELGDADDLEAPAQTGPTIVHNEFTDDLRARPGTKLASSERFSEFARKFGPALVDGRN